MTRFASGLILAAMLASCTTPAQTRPPTNPDRIAIVIPPVVDASLVPSGAMLQRYLRSDEYRDFADEIATMRRNLPARDDEKMAMKDISIHRGQVRRIFRIDRAYVEPYKAHARIRHFSERDVPDLCGNPQWRAQLQRGIGIGTEWYDESGVAVEVSQMGIEHCPALK